MDTVQERIAAYLDIMDEVVRQIESRNPLGYAEQTSLGGFSPSDIKEISTGISMSFKGQYGVFAPPVFGEDSDASDSPQMGKKAQPVNGHDRGEADHEDLIALAVAKFKATIIADEGFKSGAYDLKDVAAYVQHRNGCPIKELDINELRSLMQDEQMNMMFAKLNGAQATEDKPQTKPAAKEKVSTWEDTIHPKSGITLKDLPADKQLSLARWALTAELDEDDKEARVFQGQLLVMCGSKKWTVEKVLQMSVMDAKEYDEDGGGKGTFNDTDYKTVAKEFDEADMRDTMTDIKSFIADLVTAGDQRRELTDKPVPKKSKKNVEVPY